MNQRDEFALWLRNLQALGTAARDDLRVDIGEAAQIAASVNDSALPEKAKSALLYVASSVLINCGDELGDADVLRQGKGLAEQALISTTSNDPLHFQCRYNIANATSHLCGMDLPKPISGAVRSDWEPESVSCQVKHREDLQLVRREFLEIGDSVAADGGTRSASYCNLGNVLDHSGRWAEAYDYYLRALEADPRNGNAAGNLAELLRTRIGVGIGQTGHIAAVYDKYVTLAQELHEGTLEFASAASAERWSQLPLTESQGHLSHGLENPDGEDFEYRQWVAEYRLALSPAVEGLGTDELRWDTATIESLYGETAEEVSPPILGAMNVLKSDFLVSRRLTFEAVAQLTDGLSQTPDDSGSYVETFDGSLYGTQYSKLLLAQRSALDVLDKTAVVANDHFGVGDSPRNVRFRGFWSSKDGQLREELVRGPGRSLPNLALSELAFDIAKAGMYGSSQALRNAGTHRIVHAAVESPTGVTDDSRSKIDLLELVKSTVLALQITRSAYLYLIDLVAMWNHIDDRQGVYITLPDVRYLRDLESERDLPPESPI